MSKKQPKLALPKKPIKAKPHFYAHCYMGLIVVARRYGYNLLLHGSLDRDFDLVAVPWVDKPKSHIKLLHAFCKYLGVPIEEISSSNPKPYLGSQLPGGRMSYVINLNRGGKFNGYTDEQWYLDISITPMVVESKLEDNEKGS